MSFALAAAPAPLALEGYASLFGVADLSGDVVRAGAFRAGIAHLHGGIPLYVRHDPKLVAGRWVELKEDGRGLYVRGHLDFSLPGAALAQRMLVRGVDGLSIGFVTRAARRREKGRELTEIEIVEVSLVDFPMLPQARLTHVETKWAGSPAQ
jgi:HK97 family phage prohead protease